MMATKDILLDFGRVFDTVNREILPAILSHIGLNDLTLAFMFSAFNVDHSMSYRSFSLPPTQGVLILHQILP